MAFSRRNRTLADRNHAIGEVAAVDRMGGSIDGLLPWSTTVLSTAAWSHHVSEGPQFDAGTTPAVDVAWDEVEEWDDAMPLRPTLRPHHGEWDDLSDLVVALGKLDYAEPAEEPLWLRQFDAAEPTPAARKTEVARIKRQNKRRRATEPSPRPVVASFAPSPVEEAPEAVPTPRTCVCGHVATEHGHSGVCLSPATDGYICLCNDLTIRSAS